MRRKTMVLVVALFAGCASQIPAPGPSLDIENGFQLLEAGMRELSRNANRAKEEYFDVVIADCDAAFDGLT